MVTWFFEEAPIDWQGDPGGPYWNGKYPYWTLLVEYKNRCIDRTVLDGEQ